jgi:quercetin dioxygenase-like cupin family protein
MRHAIRIGLALVTVVLPLVSVAQAPAPPGPPAPVLREVVSGMPTGDKQEVRVIVATLKPGEMTPFHTHRFPVTVYVLEGTFTLEIEGRAAVVVTAGQAMVEPPQVKMTGYNRSATEAMRVAIFYVSDPGTPFLDVAQH